jgi:phosphate transport system substrate-binding protein
MRALLFLAAPSLAILGLAGCRDEASGGTRARISAVGSSTIFPFTAIVAERFAASSPNARAPVIESTGTGAGIRLFCAGVGAAHPDIVAASRRMQAREYRRCAANGASALMEVPIGLDGIAFAEARGGPRMALSEADLYRALAATPAGRPNVARTWRDVNPALPTIPITVYGPPATSGTRDALAELILLKGCEAVEPGVSRLPPEARKARCTRVREDGAYVDAGENDNLVVQKLGSDPRALGVFGYSYLRENTATVRGVPIDGVAPTYAAIASGRYPGARPLYLYVKTTHLDAVPGLRAFLRLYAAAWEPGGPLVERGLIALSAQARARSAAVVARERPLDPAELR